MQHYEISFRWRDQYRKGHVHNFGDGTQAVHFSDTEILNLFGGRLEFVNKKYVAGVRAGANVSELADLTRAIEKQLH